MVPRDSELGMKASTCCNEMYNSSVIENSIIDNLNIIIAIAVDCNCGYKIRHRIDGNQKNMVDGCSSCLSLRFSRATDRLHHSSSITTDNLKLELTLKLSTRLTTATMLSSA